MDLQGSDPTYAPDHFKVVKIQLMPSNLEDEDADFDPDDSQVVGHQLRKLKIHMMKLLKFWKKRLNFIKNNPDTDDLMYIN